MAESLTIPASADRRTLYKEIVPQIEALIRGETDLIANLANVSAALKETFGFFWVGFYLARDGQLVLGPFQGPIACSRINFDEGVCGQAFSRRETTIVPDVDQFPGHIACSSAARSEIVVPIFDERGDAVGVLDVDSDKADDFGPDDSEGLKAVVHLIETSLKSAAVGVDRHGDLGTGPRIEESLEGIAV